MTRLARRQKTRRLKELKRNDPWRGLDPTGYAGIDYGLGTANVDPDTGIRYGVINMNAPDLSPWAWESIESEYDPHCPKCGNDAVDTDEVGLEELDDYSIYEVDSSEDYACRTCKLLLCSDDVFGEEPSRQVLNEAGYEGVVDSDNDLFITKSPYYTRAQLCSPCAPGAGHLGHPCEGGVRTFCLGHDWWEGDKAPYPVWDVVTGKLVRP